MCGLLFAKNLCAPLTQFAFALNEMSHRGPDAQGVQDRPNGIQLGHRRLKIVDLDERSNQPFSTEDGKYTIVFNGEIYNYRELAARFQIEMRTTSDTELLLKLFALLGPRMLEHLLGMFAFVIVDNDNGSYFAARDRLGVKPLYVHRRGEVVIFSSEIKPILILTNEAKPDVFALRQYRKLRAFQNGRTLYKHVSMFPAGHYEVDGTLKRYWRLPQNEQAAPSDLEIRELLVSAVSYRCIADVSVGSYLSGGIDSSVVAALSNKPDTWVVGTKNNNEFDFAAMAASHIGSQHNEIVFDERDFLGTAERLIQARREPLSVPNEVLLYAMTAQVKSKNTVVLSGEGADELFFGYDRIFRWAGCASSFDLREFDRLYSYGTHQDDDVLEDALGPHMQLSKPISIVGSFFQLSHLHGLLRRLDNSTMQCSVEARVPFVDHRLVERMAGVAFESRLAGGVVKAQLKRVFADLLPPEIIARKKVGFPVDMTRLFGCRPEEAMDRWLDFNLRCLGIRGAEELLAI